MDVTLESSVVSLFAVGVSLDESDVSGELVGVTLESQGVVTYMPPVEAFATGIKMESSNQGRFTRQSSDQDEFRVMINRSK